MKAVQTKAAETPAKKNAPFFNKESGQDFFHDVNNEQSFFSPQKNSFFKANNNAVQTKLTVGAPGDIYEKEADATADKVVQRLNNNDAQNSIQRKTGIGDSITPLVQKKCDTCEKEEKLQKKEVIDDRDPLKNNVQTKPIFESNAEKADNEKKLQRKCDTCEKEEKLQKKPDAISSQKTSPNIESSLSSSKGSGNRLPESTRNQMERSFGTDFSNVRIHNDSAAHSMSKNLNAQAFTHGNDIYFNSGKYDTNSNTGKHLLAHELTHTVQQGSSIKRKNAPAKTTAP